MNVEIVEAGIEDLDLLMEWRMRVLQEVFDLPKGALYTKLEKENRIYYKEHLGKDHIALFSKAGSRIIGCGGLCLYQEMPSPDNVSGICGYLMNIYTLPEFRNHNAARHLVSDLIEKALQADAGKIYLETSEMGQKMYEHMGFQPMEGYLKLPVSLGQ